MKNTSPVLGIIGGSGVYNFSALKNVETIEVNTPFGKPSSPIVMGSLSGKKVAFLARHGIGHTISPTEVNYLANIYALKSLGINRVVSISACGSLREDFIPGHIVVPDQLIDYTRRRRSSFFEAGLVTHVSVADPFCMDLSGQLIKAVDKTGNIVHYGGSLITIEGPRFSTRGESNLFRSWGISIIGMTACPEAFLAREAEMCYATMAHVTDYDVWHISEEPVSVDIVIKTLMHNTQVAQQALQNLVETLEPGDCACHSALSDAIITHRDHIAPEIREKLDLLVHKYLPK
ncbi:MAG: S-methyl-5'-thioadenosine phosphorylase [Anaerolineaceae bacterium]|nr:S-methyl-5'-thioadenosine phosphorylase [Anaerolineaceae bacterium]